MKDCTEYAIVDLETTGLFPGRSDRIVEVAILRLNQRGQTIDEYASLVNPKRDIGPTHIHGVSTANVLGAPQIAEIAGDIVSILRGAVFVAHNAKFDRRFLHIALAKCGYALPDFPSLCTMELARKADCNIPGRKLEVLCKYFGVELTQAHEAMADCTATAALFNVCVDALGGWDSEELVKYRLQSFEPSAEAWPDISPSGKSYCRTKSASDLTKRRSKISQLIARLPSSTNYDIVPDEYYALLDRILEDRQIDAQEVQDLNWLAQENGISKEQAETAHREYLGNLVAVAQSDGIVTPTELVDLKEVSRLLDISSKVLDELMVEAEEAMESGLCAKCPTVSEEIRGKSVCFTGSMNSMVNGKAVTRQFAQQAASDCGMAVQKGVTKSLDYLIVADPDSMSGKAEKARKYGVRVVAEAVFWKMIGMDMR